MGMPAFPAACDRHRELTKRLDRVSQHRAARRQPDEVGVRTPNTWQQGQRRGDPGWRIHAPPEFRRDAVELARSSDKTIAQVAKELGLNQETLRSYDGSSGTRPTVASGFYDWAHRGPSTP